MKKKGSPVGENIKGKGREGKISKTKMTTKRIPKIILKELGYDYYMSVTSDFRPWKNLRDWDSISKYLLSDQVCKEFSDLKRAYEDHHLQIEAKKSVKPVPVDWDYFRKRIPSRLIDHYKAQFEARASQIPKYVDTVTPKYKSEFEKIAADLEVADKKARKERERIEREMLELEDLEAKIDTMTAQEYFQAHPDVKKRIDDEIRNDIWD